MRVAGYRPGGVVRVANAPAPPRIFEFTVARVTVRYSLESIDRWEQGACRVVQDRSAALDRSAVIRAATADEAIEAFAAAIGDDRGDITLRRAYGEPEVLGRVEYRIVGDFRQVNP